MSKTNRTPHKKAKIIGSPGTGKTTYLLNLITQAAQKYAPDRIGAVSLTNAAVEEMRDRVKKETGLPRAAAKNITTVHSACFRLLELKKEQVADKKIKEFNEAYPRWEIPLDTEITEDEHYLEENAQFTAKQNKMRFAEIQILRHKQIPVEKWPDLFLKEMYSDWCDWMAENNYTDFTGMLEKTLESGLGPDIDILLVDEAQDISKLGINLLEMWGKDLTSTVYVGDSDQAILRFAGAVPEAFINLDHTWMKVLGKSYRVPKKVHEYAMELISQAKDRENVSYEPTEVEGKVIRGCSEPDLSLEGTHMILGRCNFHLNRWRKWLMENGVVWHNPYRPGDRLYNPLNTKIWRAARNYVKVCRGEEIGGRDLKHMVKNMIAEGNIERGWKSKADEMIEDGENLDLFGLISLGIFTKEFLKFEKKIDEVFVVKGQSGEMLLKVDDVMEEPRVILGTVHCSPPDEPVLTTSGEVPIGELDSEKHRLAGFDQKTHRFYWGGRNGPGGTRKNGGYPFIKESRHYSGNIITIKTDKSETRVTPEHRVMTKFSDNFFQKYIVYLMRRGNWWRVGICTSGYRPYKAGGLAGRLSTEQADAGWILGIFETRKEAAYEETKIQGFYGILGITFQVVSKGRSLDTKQLHSIHENISQKVGIRVKQLFSDFGLDEDQPLYRRGIETTDDIKRNMSKAFLTAAANLLTGYMEALIVPDSFLNHGPGIQKPEFLKIDISKKYYDGEVFSLDVKPYHYYISGKMVCHNSVKGGESDHVWIDMGTSGACLRASNERVEAFYDEVRVAYVGVTRARESLGLISERGLRGKVW